jgi:hypothetical protein
MGGSVPVSPGRRRQTETKTRGEIMEEAERCTDILGMGGEGRAWRHDTCLRD